MIGLLWKQKVSISSPGFLLRLIPTSTIIHWYWWNIIRMSIHHHFLLVKNMPEISSKSIAGFDVFPFRLSVPDCSPKHPYWLALSERAPKESSTPMQSRIDLWFWSQILPFLCGVKLLHQRSTGWVLYQVWSSVQIAAPQRHKILLGHLVWFIRKGGHTWCKIPN